MESKEVVFTYEALYELLRREKSREELQKIDLTFFNDVLKYLKDKQSSYDDSFAKNDVFSQAEREKISIQLSNAKRLLRDLYDIRERKILIMAVNHCRTKAHLVDSANLLPEESLMFQSICAVLSQHRFGVLQKLCDLRKPELFPCILPVPEKISEKVEELKTVDKKQIKFLESIEPFAGEELEMYGPFAKDESAILPCELADILIAQGKAVEL